MEFDIENKENYDPKRQTYLPFNIIKSQKRYEILKNYTTKNKKITLKTEVIESNLKGKLSVPLEFEDESINIFSY